MLRRLSIIVIKLGISTHTCCQDPRIVSAANDHTGAMRLAFWHEALESPLLQQRVASSKEETVKLPNLHSLFANFALVYSEPYC